MRVALVLMVFAAVGASVAVAATSHAQLSVVATAPVSVQGSSFKARERVTVTLVAAARRARIVTADAAGAFRATFARVAIRRCESYFVRAKGNRGSVATLKVTPECLPSASLGGADAPLMPTDPTPKKP